MTPWIAAFQAPLSMGFPMARILEWVVISFIRGSSQKVKWSESHSVMPNSLQPRGLYTVHGILQARILAWVAYPFSRGPSWPRNWTRVSCIAGRFFTAFYRGSELKSHVYNHGTASIVPMEVNTDSRLDFFILGAVVCYFQPVNFFFLSPFDNSMKASQLFSFNSCFSQF